VKGEGASLAGRATARSPRQVAVESGADGAQQAAPLRAAVRRNGPRVNQFDEGDDPPRMGGRARD